MDELPDNLKRALDALDERAGRAAARVDSARVATRVLERLRAGDRLESPRVFWRLTLVRVAAAVVVLLAGGATLSRLGWRPFAARATALPVVASAEELSSTDLTDVLNAMDSVRAAGRSIAPAPVTIEDLNEQELKALLAALNAPVEKT